MLLRLLCCCAGVYLRCWLFCRAGVFVALVRRLYSCACCAGTFIVLHVGDFVVLVVWCAGDCAAGEFVVDALAVCLLCWFICCVGHFSVMVRLLC